MKQQALLLSSSLCPRATSLTFSPSISLPIQGFHRRPLAISAALESTDTEQEEEQQLSARERRQLRNQRRETRAAYNWKEDVEAKLIKKPKKRFASWTEELNLDTLAIEGPQWWIVRVGRLRGQETADLVARLLVKNYPHIDFKVIALPSVGS